MFPLRNEEQEKIAAINEQRVEEVINIIGSDRKEPPRESFFVATSSYNAAAINSGFTLLALLLLRSIVTAGDGEPVLIWWILLAVAAVTCIVANITAGNVKAEVRGDRINIGRKSFHCSQIDLLKGYDTSYIVLFSGDKRIFKVSMIDDNCDELVKWAKTMGIHTEYIYTDDETPKHRKVLFYAGAAVLFAVISLLFIWFAIKL